jgi:hypothetical protein
VCPLGATSARIKAEMALKASIIAQPVHYWKMFTYRVHRGILA